MLRQLTVSRLATVLEPSPVVTLSIESERVTVDKSGQVLP